MGYFLAPEPSGLKQSFGDRDTVHMFTQEKKQQKGPWELPTHKWYRVREKKGAHGMPIRDGTVTCQSGDRVCVHFDDGWVERRSIGDFVRFPAIAEDAATAEAAVGAAAPAAQERDYRNINALNLDRGNPGWWQ